MSTLASKIAKASEIVGGALNPDKKNMQDRYEYVSADKILSVAGQALAEAGVVVLPSITSSDVQAFDRGGGKNRYDARVQFVFFVADDEGQMELMWAGYGSDYTVPDKAVYKAITSGHKYFLAKLLNIGAGNEDGEHESGNGSTNANSNGAVAGTRNNGAAPCKVCHAPVGKPHASSCTAAESAPTVSSLADVEELPFDGAPTATEEFNAIPSAPPVTNGNGHKSNGAAKRAAQAQSQPADEKGKMHGILAQMSGGLDADGFRHFLARKWSDGKHAATSTMGADDVGLFTEWLEDVKRGRADVKLPDLRKEFQSAVPA